MAGTKLKGFKGILKKGGTKDRDSTSNEIPADENEALNAGGEDAAMARDGGIGDGGDAVPNKDSGAATQVEATNGEDSAVDLTAPDLVIQPQPDPNDQPTKFRPVDEEDDEDFVLERHTTASKSMIRGRILSTQLSNSINLARSHTTWKEQAWNRLESEMRHDESRRRSRKQISADHFRTDALNLRKQDPTVEIVVAALVRYLEMDEPSRLTVYRILTYAVEAFFSNLYKEMNNEVIEDIKELSKVVVRVGIQYGNRGGPIRKEVLSLIQSTTVFSGESTVVSVLGTIREYITLKDDGLKQDPDHTDSLSIAMAMFTQLLLRCRMRDEKVGKAVRVLLRKSSWPTLKNESCICAAELVRVHLGGTADESTISKAVDIIINRDATSASGVAYLAAVFAPLIKPSQHASKFRTACVEYLAESSELNEQKLYGLAIARIGRAKAETVWETYLTRSTAADARKSANQHRSMFADEDGGVANYETEPKVGEEPEMGEDGERARHSEAALDHQDSSKSLDDGDGLSRNASGRESSRFISSDGQRDSSASMTSDGDDLTSMASSRSSRRSFLNRERKMLSGKGIGKRELRQTISKKGMRGEDTVRNQSRLFRRSEQSARRSQMAPFLDNDLDLGPAPVINYDSFVGTLDLVIRAKLYKNVEGVTYAVAASTQEWRTKEFADEIFPLAVGLLNERSRELGGILPAVIRGLVQGLTRGVASTVQLRLVEAIHDYLKRDDHDDTDVTDGISLQVAAACLREVGSDTAKISKVLDRLVSLALGIVGTISTFSRVAGAEFLGLLASAVPMKRERIVTKVAERLRVATIELQTSTSESDDKSLPTGLYTIIGSSASLVCLVDGASASLGLPFDILERLGEIAFTLVRGNMTVPGGPEGVISAICRRCGWSIVASLLRYDLPQFFSLSRVRMLLLLWRLEYGDSAAHSEMQNQFGSQIPQAVDDSFASLARSDSARSQGDDQDYSMTFTRSASRAKKSKSWKLPLMGGSSRKMKTQTLEVGNDFRDSSRRTSSRSMLSRSGNSRVTRPPNHQSSGRMSRQGSFSGSRSYSRAYSSTSRNSSFVKRRSAKIASFLGRGRSRRSSRAKQDPDLDLKDLFEDSFDLTRIQRRLDRAEKDPGFSGYSYSRTGVVMVEKNSTVVASIADHNSTARAAATAALFQILHRNFKGISEVEKETLVGKISCLAAQRLAQDSLKGVEKYVWSIEVWWILHCIAAKAPSERVGEVCFHLALRVALRLQFQVTDDKTLSEAADATKARLYDLLLPLMHMDAFNTPETVTSVAETMTLASDAIAALAIREDRYGVSVLETMTSNLSSFSPAFAATICRSIATRLDSDSVVKHGAIFLHLQGLLQKTALAAAPYFTIHPSDVFTDESEESRDVLTPSIFAAVAKAYHEIGRHCGDIVLTGLLENVQSMHDRYPDISVATIHLLGTLLQDSNLLEGDIAEKATIALEEALNGEDGATRVSAALSLGVGCSSKSVAKRALTLMQGMVVAMSNERGQSNSDFSSNLYVPESNLKAARAIIENCGDVAAFGHGATGVIRACIRNNMDIADNAALIAEEIALELISWEVLPAPVTRTMGLNLLTAKWKRTIDEFIVDRRQVHLHDLWSSVATARKIGWALYEALITPAEERYHMVREAAVASLAMLIHAVGAAKVVLTFEDLPEMLFVALDNGCMTAAPILLAFTKVDCDRRFGFWLDLTRNIYNGGPKMQDMEINQRWESNVSRFGIKVVVGKLMDDAGRNLYADEWDASPITRGVAVYIARILTETASKIPTQMEKIKQRKGPKFRNMYASVKDILFFAFEAVSGSNRNIVTITQGLFMLDLLIRNNLERTSFMEDLPSGKLSRVLRKLLRADVHPDVITTALSVTGSILVSTSETDLFEEGLVRSLFTKDPSGIHLSFQYDNIAEKFSSESAFGALEALAKTIWGAVEEKKITLLKKLSNRLGIFYRIFCGVCGDFSTVAIDQGESLQMFGSTVGSTAFEASCEGLFTTYAPMMLFTAMLIWSQKVVPLSASDFSNACVEWFNPRAPGVHLSRSENPISVLLSLCVWWLQKGIDKSENYSEQTKKELLDHCVTAVTKVAAAERARVPVDLVEEVVTAMTPFDAAGAQKMKSALAKVKTLKSPVDPDHKDTMNCIGLLTAATSAPEVLQQAIKYLINTLGTVNEGASSVVLSRYAYATLHGLFSLLEKANVGVKTQTKDGLVELLNISLRLNIEVGWALDEMITVKAMDSMRKFAEEGDLVSMDIAMEFAATACLWAQKGPRGVKCLDRIFYGIEEGLKVGTTESRLKLLRNDTYMKKAIDVLADKQSQRSTRCVSALWGRIFVLAADQNSGQVGQVCRRLLEEALAGENKSESRREGVSSVLLAITRHAEDARFQSRTVLGDTLFGDLEEVMNPDYVEPLPERGNNVAFEEGMMEEGNIPGVEAGGDYTEDYPTDATATDTDGDMG